MNWQAILDREVLGNTVSIWGAAAFLAALTWGALAVIRWAVSRYLASTSAHTTTALDDVVAKVLAKTRWFFYFPVALLAGSEILLLPTSADNALRKAVLVGVLIQCGVWARVAIHAGVDAWVVSKGEQNGGSHATMAAGMKFITELVAWSIICVFVLANFGIEVSALLAGLGVGGIAVALAAQNVLGDLFASISIYVDRPFDIGDSVVIGDVTGTVEMVGIRSSRIRAASGEQVVFPNRDLVQSRIRNFRRLQHRRIVFSLGVVYGTPHATLQRIPEVVKDIVTAVSVLRFERCYFKSYGDFALVYEVSYFVESTDDHLDKQQQVNLEIYRRFEELGIEFAFPTQTVFVHQVTAKAQA